MGKLFDSLVITLQILGKLPECKQIFLHGLLEQRVRKLKAVQPRKMFLRPVGLSVEEKAVTCAQGDDLLLCLLEHGLGIVAHTDILFHSVIFLSRNIHAAV